MDLLVAYQDDSAGYNMAKSLLPDMTKSDHNNNENGEIYHGAFFDLLVIPTPTICADWLDTKYDYDSFVFLSKHAAKSGVLALTCHSTGNFSKAQFGGNDNQVAIPYPSLQKQYLQKLLENKKQFTDFDITIEATHHGPSGLSKPSIFIEIGTTPTQWDDKKLCSQVASIVLETMKMNRDNIDYAICFGGTHYSTKFTHELLHGKLGLGTVMPKHALENLDQKLFDHIIHRNSTASTILLDWTGLGPHKQKVLELVQQTNLEIIKL